MAVFGVSQTGPAAIGHRCRHSLHAEAHAARARLPRQEGAAAAQDEYWSLREMQVQLEAEEASQASKAELAPPPPRARNLEAPGPPSSAPLIARYS